MALATPQRALFAALIIAIVITASILVENPLILLGAGIVAASAAAPRLAVVIAIPLTVLASLLPGSGAVTLAVTAVIQIGVLASCRRNLQMGPVVAVAALTVLLTLSFLDSPRGFSVGIDAARNTLLSTIIGVTLVLSAIAAEVDLDALLKALAGSGAIGSIYLLNSGLFVGGRIATENLNANSIGHVAALGFLAAWGAFLCSRRPWWLLCASPAALLITLSQSRGALVVAVAGVALPWIFWPLSFGRLVLGGSIATALYAAWPIVSSGLAQFFSARTYTETETRVNVLQVAVRAVAEHPLSGLGWRTFPDYSYSHLGVILETHNEYMRVAAESGLLALAALLTLAFMGLHPSVVHSIDRALKGVLIGGLTALAFANTLSLLAICAPTWLALGAILSTRGRSATNTERNSPAGRPTHSNSLSATAPLSARSPIRERVAANQTESSHPRIAKRR